jgi:hypothetical protein
LRLSLVWQQALVRVDAPALRHPDTAEGRAADRRERVVVGDHRVHGRLEVDGRPLVVEVAEAVVASPGSAMSQAIASAVAASASALVAGRSRIRP